MLPFMEAVGAHVPCRGCNYRQLSSAAHEAPHSFLSGNGRWALRTQRELLAQVRKWRRNKNHAEMQAAGVNKLHWALQDIYFPGVNPAVVAPQDIMHTFADGITRHEGAWLVYMLHSRGYVKFGIVNAAIRQYRWPRDCRVPQMPDSVKDGETGNFPRQAATLGMSASQTFTFAIHSIALLTPLLPDNALREPFWQAWVAHVRVLEMALRPRYTLADVTKFDKLITRHHQLFSQVCVASPPPPPPPSPPPCVTSVLHSCNTDVTHIV